MRPQLTLFLGINPHVARLSVNKLYIILFRFFFRYKWSFQSSLSTESQFWFHMSSFFLWGVLRILGTLHGPMGRGLDQSWRQHTPISHISQLHSQIPQHTTLSTCPTGVYLVSRSQWRHPRMSSLRYVAWEGYKGWSTMVLGVDLVLVFCSCCLGVCNCHL